MKTSFLLLLLLNLVACVPTQETEFQKIDIAGIEDGEVLDKEIPVKEVEDEVIVKCEDIKYEDVCREKPKCQVLLDEFEDKFLSCIPVKKEESDDDKKEVVEEKKDEEKEMQEAVAKEGQCDEQKDDEKFVIICHIPSGNPKNAHSICISKQGWLHGHKDRHGREDSRDYLGACKDQDLPVDPDDID